MQAYLKTYHADTLVDAELVDLPEDYDGNPYGDTVPFSVGSNQELVVIDEEPTYESHEYHPTRVDGLDRNLRELNRADWNNGYRCICKACCEAYVSRLNHIDLIKTKNKGE